MRNKRYWPEETVNEAIALRNAGASYQEIVEKYGVSKSTLFYWLRGCRLSSEDVKKLRQKLGKAMQPAGARASHERRLERLKVIRLQVKQKLNAVDHESIELKRLLISMLYWAEGSKGGGSLIFANTDPALCVLYLKLLRDVYHIDERKIRIRVHLHVYHDIRTTFSYWSKLLRVPLSQFGKPYVKPRSKMKKFRNNFAGICFIKYHSTNLKEEVLQTAYQLAGKIGI